MFEYFIKVVPTTYTKGSKTLETNQFSTTEYLRRTDPQQMMGVLPGVYFFLRNEPDSRCGA